MNGAPELGVRFWERLAQEADASHARGDEATRFYVGAGTALTAWLLQNSACPPLYATAVLALGVVGAGHVVYHHNRGFRLQQRAGAAARELAKLAQLPETIKTWDESDALTVKNLFVPGHPAAQIVYGAFVVLVIHLVFAAVLFFNVVHAG